MNELIYEIKTFEDIRHIDKYGNEYWYARELQEALEYNKWENFYKVIKKAMIAFETSNNGVLNHFLEVRKIVNAGVTTKQISDYKLSRYACYLIVQNGDPRKEIIALGQAYFEIQTRKQEISELEYNELSEDEKRFYQRSRIRKWNYTLNKTASKAVVKNFDKFHNAGYRGLYGVETADDIAKKN